MKSNTFGIFDGKQETTKTQPPGDMGEGLRKYEKFHLYAL